MVLARFADERVIVVANRGPRSLKNATERPAVPDCTQRKLQSIVAVSNSR
jgi:hypothetical protein